MDDLLRRFLTKIGISDLKPFEEGSFLDCHCEKESNRVIGKIRFPHYLDYSAYLVILELFARNDTQAAKMSTYQQSSYLC